MRDRTKETPKTTRASMKETFRRYNLMPANVRLTTWDRLKLMKISVSDKKKAKVWIRTGICQGVAWRPTRDE